MYNNFSLLNLVGGLSKTLNIATQMIPIYKQVKPLIANSNKILNNLQNIKIPKNQNNKVDNNKNKTVILPTNVPTFFQ